MAGIPELITRSQADTLMIGVAVLGVIVGGLAFANARRKGENAVRSGLLFGGPPLLAALLWPIYNLLTDRIGLDRVANLLVNLALFVVVGGVVGVVWGIRHPLPLGPEPLPLSPSPAEQERGNPEG